MTYQRQEEFEMETLAQEVEDHGQDNGALTAHDRCDSCGSQAYVRAITEHGELLFCSHHAKKHHEKLSPIVKEWHDESHRLEASH